MKTTYWLPIMLSLAAAGATAQTVTEVILPRYGVNGNDTALRAPSAALLTVSGLLPNATYRYYVSGDYNHTTLTNNGAGNYFGINNVPNNAGYIQGYTTQKALNGSLLANDEFATATPGRYSEFTTDASGSYTGWFALQPTGNPRFTVGNEVRFGLILNDGADGTSVSSRLYTTETLLMLGPGTGEGVNQATFLVGDSLGAPGETMVVIYDNVEGTGRPIWASWVEPDGIAGAPGSLWDTYVTAGRWGAYVPNDLANGIRRVEYWDIGSGSLLGVATDDDGVWTPINEPQFLTANGDTRFNGGTTTLIGIIAPIPEPSAAALLLLGALGLAWRRRR
jgi:hypothetical protein